MTIGRMGDYGVLWCQLRGLVDGSDNNVDWFSGHAGLKGGYRRLEGRQNTADTSVLDAVLPCLVMNPGAPGVVNSAASQLCIAGYGIGCAT